MRFTLPRFPEPVRVGRFRIDAAGLTHESFRGRYLGPAQLAGGNVCDFLRKQKGIGQDERGALLQAVQLAVYLHNVCIEHNTATAFPDAMLFAELRERSSY